MSNTPATEKPKPVVDLDLLYASIQTCIIRSDLAAKEASRGREASELAVKAVSKLADDHFELRTGIPPTWGRRLALAGIAGGAGAVTAGALWLALYLVQTHFVAFL